MKKQVINEMQFSFISKSENESFARQTVCSFVAQADPTMEEMSDIRIIVSEAVTNSIVHGYRGRLGIITVEVKLYSDSTVRIKIKDKGQGIADLEKCMQPLYTTDPEGERGGMGLPIMKTLAKDFKISSAVDKGTVVVAIVDLSSNT